MIVLLGDFLGPDYGFLGLDCKFVETHGLSLYSSSPVVRNGRKTNVRGGKRANVVPIPTKCLIGSYYVSGVTGVRRRVPFWQFGWVLLVVKTSCADINLK
jgi:hypothetical protein